VAHATGCIGHSYGFSRVKQVAAVSHWPTHVLSMVVRLHTGRPPNSAIRFTSVQTPSLCQIDCRAGPALTRSSSLTFETSSAAAPQMEGSWKQRRSSGRVGLKRHRQAGCFSLSSMTQRIHGNRFCRSFSMYLLPATLLIAAPIIALLARRHPCALPVCRPARSRRDRRSPNLRQNPNRPAAAQAAWLCWSESTGYRSA
jgi:hypothetical protein